MKKVIIIGGGIAGLTAGIYARQYGFETEVYEKHIIPGGECTGWSRQGYFIDNCIHWLTDACPGSEMYKIWENIGVMGPSVGVIREDAFYSMEYQGKTLHFYRDLDRARAEFLEMAPEDEVKINRFFDHVKLAEKMSIPTEKPVSDMNFLEMMKMGMGMAEVGKVMKEYGKETIPELAERFTNPVIKEMMRRYYTYNFMAFTLLMSYAFLSGGNGIIPEGGSLKMAERITERYRSLGGKLFTGKEVSKISVQGKKASGICLADGTEITADYIICAADTYVTFTKLLDEKYWDPRLKKLYSDDKHKVNSAFQVAFGIIGEEETGVPSGSFVFPCEELQVGTKKETFMATRMYDYDMTLFPKDKRVIQCNFIQEGADYEYWKQLYSDKQAYKQEKERLAEEIRQRIIKQFPQLESRLIILDAFSPITYERYCSAYRGAYMSFFPQKGAGNVYMKNTVKGLDNVLIASQWLSQNGGLPTAATSGKFAADKLAQL